MSINTLVFPGTDHLYTHRFKDKLQSIIEDVWRDYELYITDNPAPKTDRLHRVLGFDRYAELRRLMVFYYSLKEEDAKAIVSFEELLNNQLTLFLSRSGADSIEVGESGFEPISDGESLFKVSEISKKMLEDRKGRFIA